MIKVVKGVIYVDGNAWCTFSDEARPKVLKAYGEYLRLRRSQHHESIWKETFRSVEEVRYEAIP